MFANAVAWGFEKIIGLVANLLPALGINPELLTKFDAVLTIFISLVETAAWFLPLQEIVMCMSIMLIVDNWVYITKFTKFIIKILPFT